MMLAWLFKGVNDQQNDTLDVISDLPPTARQDSSR